MHFSCAKFSAGFLIFLVLSWSKVCLSEEEQAPRIASYRIDVRLDAEEKRLLGKEVLTFVNTSKVSVDTLFLHLYPNAFESDTTTLMKESPFPDRIEKREKYRGFMRIESVKTGSGMNLTDEKIIDETVMKLPLTHSLPPRGRIELQIEFLVKLPEILVRLGYSGEHFMISQWFPKMAVLEEDGRWNAHQYHFTGEFFADFGTYDVSITVPPEYVVGASGYLVEDKENANFTRTFVFHAEDVHDFAWAASLDYRISHRMVDGIDLNFFYKPEHEESVDRIMEYAEFALRFYSLAFGRYHYDHFTIVDAKVGLGGGAMEYPTLITISPSRAPQEKARMDAWIIFHEIAHQWWYGMVASNEVEEAWLDEGFAVYSGRRALEQRFGKAANFVDLWGIEVGDLEFTRLENLFDLQSDPVVRNSWEFRNYLSYRAKVYSKASLILETLRNYLGEEKMNELIREYFRRYKFKHPTTADFIQVVDEFAGEDLRSLLEQLVFGTGVCDYEVTRIESVPIENEDEKGRYKTQVVLRRLGEVIIPVDVLIQLKDGDQIRQVWDGKERWTKIEIETDSKIKAAILDPENKIALDVNVNNNSLTARTSDSVLMKLSTQSLFWLEILVDWMTCF
ncbi:MAG: M1 family metallopeptidase [Candidatus Zixiibacteriota bacterium]